MDHQVPDDHLESITPDNDPYVLLLENELDLLEMLRRGLERRGLRVAPAANIAQAREAVKLYGERLSVAVLDMHLADPEQPHMTGADFGIELREQLRHLPEFLIYSAVEERDYYRLALRLGVAAYLPKVETPVRELYQHVRALALRWALRAEREGILAKIDRIAARSRTEWHARMSFCREILARELARTLGESYPFVLVLSGADGQYDSAGKAALPPGQPLAAQVIQDLTHGEAQRTDPRILDVHQLNHLEETVQQALRPLHGAVLVPLCGDHEIRLSLLLLPPGESSLQDDPVVLAAALGQYLRPAMTGHLLLLTTKWAEIYMRRQEQLRATARFCLFVGEEEVTSLAEGVEAGDFNPAGFHFQRLADFADQLQEIGYLLTSLSGSKTPNSGSERPLQRISLRGVVYKAWREVAARLGITHPQFLALEDGDWQIEGDPVQLERAICGVLHWLAQRSLQTQNSSEAAIQVGWQQQDGEHMVVFEDHSRRIPDPLRKRLFSPFSESLKPLPDNWKTPDKLMPLFLARALVEAGSNEGILEDHSGELPNTASGHRLVMRFPTTTASLNQLGA